MSLSNATGDGGIFPEINGVFKKVLLPLDLESHPFQIGWYNDLVGPRFALEYSPNTLAFVVISGPDIFEKCVLPYLSSTLAADPNLVANDPLDDAMVNAFKLVQKDLEALQFETIMLHDFELYPSRKPKILVQTAAHVAGAVQYFHKSNLSVKIQEEHFSKESDLAGVAVHPVYGGWFAIRGVIIFKNVELNEDDNCLPRPEPLTLIKDEEKVVTLLREFAYNWEEEKWRNIYKGSGSEYSQDFKDFLFTLPGQRWEFLKNRCLL